MARRPFIPRARRDARRPTLFIALVCPACSSDAVAVAERHAHGPAHWWARMRCGACGRWRETIVARSLFASLERLIEVDLAAIREAIARLERADERVDDALEAAFLAA
jgi:uncharacterized Zn finger protein